MYPRRDETRGVSGYVALGAACTTICSVEYGTSEGVCTHPMKRQETRGVTGYVPLGAACTTICSVEYGTSEGVCIYAMTRQEESLVMFP